MVADKNDPSRKGAAGLIKKDIFPATLVKEKRLLHPIDRISEILFGLIMALTFTCTISVATSSKADVKEMLIGAIGCNLAWGLVDAVIFILANLAERGRGKIILNFVRKTNNREKANELIADVLPPIVSSVMEPQNLDSIRERLLKLPESGLRVRLTARDFFMALGIFLLVFLSTFPIVLPFLLIDQAHRALRVSNLVAIALMFIDGWLLAYYGGYNKWLMGFFMILLGAALVALTIALGG